jgi:hypothetical protein
MANDLRALNQRMLGLSKRVTENANEIVKAADTDFITEVIDRAPVDTGLTVSSWKVGLNYKPVGTRLFVPGKLGSTATANREAVKSVVLPTISKRITGETIFFANQTPYLTFINGGEYEQAIDSAYKRAYDAAKNRKIV